MIRRRTFLKLSFAALPFARWSEAKSLSQKNQFEGRIVTVAGPIAADELGTTLIHEHILVDFSGYKLYNTNDWDDEQVIHKMLPYLQELKDAGCRSFVDCTPNFLGRDPALLRSLSKASGLHIITNTGYYGGSDNKYLPPQAFSETADQLATRWIREAMDGLDALDIYPGFIKISVNPGALSEVSQKLAKAAAITHMRTGLTIASHTGPAIAASEQINILKDNGVAPDAFIWVHAQGATSDDHIRAAKQGAWVSLDGLADDNVDHYTLLLTNLKKSNLLSRTLVSHDAGWYEPGKPNGGTVRGYTTLFRLLIPRLKASGFSSDDVHQLTVVNPASAFKVSVRKL
ncbi:MAG: phosphotriesterase [Chryseolinea sp.]